MTLICEIAIGTFLGLGLFSVFITLAVPWVLAMLFESAEKLYASKHS